MACEPEAEGGKPLMGEWYSAKSFISSLNVFLDQGSHRGGHPERELAEIGRDNGPAEVIARLHKTEAVDGKVGGERALQGWMVVPAHALLGVEDEYWRAETGRHDDIALYSAVVDIASDSSQQLASLPEEKSGDIFSCLAGRVFRQVPYMARPRHHQVIVLCHGEQLGVQDTVRLSQQLHGALIDVFHLGAPFILLRATDERINTQSWVRGIDRVVQVFVDLSFSMAISSNQHGELQHAVHEEGPVTDAGATDGK